MSSIPEQEELTHDFPGLKIRDGGPCARLAAFLGKWVTGAEVMRVLEKLSSLIMLDFFEGEVYHFGLVLSPLASLLCVKVACHGFPSPHNNSEKKGTLMLSSVI